MQRRNKKPSLASRAGSSAAARIELVAVPGIPEFRPADNLPKIIFAALRRAKLKLHDGDVLVVAQKIVSKSENRIALLSQQKPSAEAENLARSLKKDPRLMEIILGETRRVVRSEHVLIVETHHGLICANAGVDQSNVPGDDAVTLLPKDPDRSAHQIAAALSKLSSKKVAVVISDTFGRPWRLGLTNVAIGIAGVPALVDLRGFRDQHGKLLHATVIAVADELACAAGLAMQKSAATPVVLIRGYRYIPTEDLAARIIRPAQEDLFR